MKIFKIFVYIFKTIFIIIKYTFKLLFSGLDKVISDIKKNLRFSLNFKITAAYTLLFSIILSVVSFTIFIGFNYFLEYQGKQKAEGYKNYYEARIKNNDLNNLEMSPILNYDETDISIWKNDKTIYKSSDSKTEYTEEYNMETLWIGSERVIADVYYLDINGSSYKIQIIKSLKKETYYSSVLGLALALIDIFIIWISLITGSKTSRRVLKPIDAMTDTVKKISISKLSTRLNVEGTQDELKDLSRTFNNMLDRIQESYEKENQFVSDASHELRTPIAVIQGYINLLDRWGKNDKEILDEGITAIKKETENMKDLVEKLLFLARADKNTQIVNKEDFNINEVIEEVVKETKMIDDNHNISYEGVGDIIINGDIKLIKEMFRIFIDNSIKYTNPGGEIKITSSLNNNKAVFTISDNGTGIKKEDLPYIFDRFYRADKSRTKKSGGTGLGLSIAKWIVMIHNGEISVESKLDYGTKIIITLDGKTVSLG
ncbi:MAG: HAMP domain-containing sensor histidine kinase [Clostridiaceae bacterium]